MLGRMPTDWSDQIIVCELSDEPQLSEEIANLFVATTPAAGRPPKHVVLNLSGVGYVSSSHLAQLLRLRKRLADHGRTMVLCSLNDNVWSVMLLTGLDRVFRFAPDPMTALAGLQLQG